MTDASRASRFAWGPGDLRPVPDSLDSLGMRPLARRTPDQLIQGSEAAMAVGVPDIAGEVGNVVICGMGGSAFAGEALAALPGGCRVPVAVNRSYALPAYVDARSFVVAVSFSGETEETLSSFRLARERGARLVAIASGGTLEAFAREWGVPFVTVDGAIPQPRAAFGALFGALWTVMGRAGLMGLAEAELPDAAGEVGDSAGKVRDAAGELREAAEELRKSFLAAEKNLFIQDLAAKLYGKIPLVWGSEGFASAAATRFRTQVNENARMPAFSSVVPELMHNEVAGWGQLGDVTRQLVVAVALRHDYEHPQVARRFELLREIAGESLCDMVEVRAAGSTALAQFLDLVAGADLVSLELAREERIDPGPVPLLADLKRRLADVPS